MSDTSLLLRCRRGRQRRDALVLCLGLGLVALVLGLLGVLTGTYSLTPSQLLEVLQGRGRPAVVRLLWEWRLPRTLFCLVGGTALAVSGALFQRLTRNPLGSPDVIGFGTGAYTGVLIVTLVLGSPRYLSLVMGAFLGGVATAVVVYLLAWRRGVQGFRLILVGIGTSACLAGVNNLLLIRSGAQRAQEASSWVFGSFASLGFAQFWPFLVLVLVLLVVVGTQASRLAQLELGDEVAGAHGVRVEAVRLVVVLVGIGLMAAVTAAAGPIAFVALVAPQIAHRILPGRGLHLGVSGLVGAVLLQGSDLLGQRLDASVGLVTVVLGGGYFLWLIVGGRRRGHGSRDIGGIT
ncbi:iron chelate uptake ABC transporter family permease subunit [Arachnia propionica]|uniref:FecCD family ABC transporter permease n=1 Tax=Arachnia propionica TaxID=1750 RepID=UPI001C8CC5D8|nr:iron chelate uptake ABC transporter family permease subunit [Arachnia propionica]